jgi:hypothetical protein
LAAIPIDAVGTLRAELGQFDRAHIRFTPLLEGNGDQDDHLISVLLQNV